jgi:hypothetical protein
VLQTRSQAAILKAVHAAMIDLRRSAYKRQPLLSDAVEWLPVRLNDI